MAFRKHLQEVQKHVKRLSLSFRPCHHVGVGEGLNMSQMFQDILRRYLTWNTVVSKGQQVGPRMVSGGS